MRGLLRHRDACVYLTGQIFSLFGDSCLWLAMGIWVKTLTHSNAAAGLTFFFFTAPSLFAPAASLVVDRLRRRPLLIAVNALSGGVVLLLLGVHGAGQVWLIYVVMALYGMSHSVLGSAQSALLTAMVPAELLPDANAGLRTAQEALRLVAPLAGAGLFVAVGGHVIAIIDAATFALPVISLLVLRVAEPAPHPLAQRWRKEITAGIQHVLRIAELRHMIIACACAFAVLGFDETVVYAITGDGLHKPAAFVGILIAIQGAGAVIGGPTAAMLGRRIGEARLVGISLALIAAAAVLEIPPDLPSVVAGVIVFGVATPWLFVGFVSLVQRLTPAELQGRAYSAATTLVSTPQTISIAAGAALISVIGYRPLLGAMAVVVALAATYLLTRAEVRHGLGIRSTEQRPLTGPSARRVRRAGRAGAGRLEPEQ
jgi:MFS family permease